MSGSEVEEEQISQRVLKLVDSSGEQEYEETLSFDEKDNLDSTNEIISTESSPEVEKKVHDQNVVTFRKINVVNDSDSSPSKRKTRVYRKSNIEDSDKEERNDDKRKRKKKDSGHRRKSDIERDIDRRGRDKKSLAIEESRRRSEISASSLRRRYSHSGENEKENEYTEDDSELQKLHKGIKQVSPFFDESMCRKIEKKIDQIAEKASCGLYKQKTYDRAPLRNKYFFGEGYTYGKQMNHRGPGQERLHAKGEVDEIPKWIQKHVIQKVYDEKLVPEGFINSAVVNEYFPGGCIVSHIDPLHIFDRPIITISFNSKSYLSFGVKFTFNPIRTSKPILALPLDRGCLTMIR